MKTVDKEIVRTRFGRNFKTYQYEASVQKQVASQLIRSFKHLQFDKINRALEIGCGTGFLTEQILSNYNIGSFYLNDLVSPMPPELIQIAVDLAFYNYSFLPGDAESIHFPQDLDAIFSSSTIQWFTDLKSFSFKAAKALKESGKLAFSTYGPENLTEIKSTLGIGLDYKSLDELSVIFSDDFDILYKKSWKETVWFHSPWEVLRHLKKTGVNSCSTERFGRGRLREFEQDYYQKFANEEGKVCLTYEPMICIMRKI